MKAVILAGGYGTRLSEETMNQPKPMVTIGDRPIIWHIMKIFEYYGITDFIVCCGYKGYVLKEYFANYYLHNSDFSIDLKDATIDIISRKSESWKINFFQGVPSPAAAGLVLLPLILNLSGLIQYENYAVLSSIAILTTSILMVSKVPTYSLKRITIPRSLGAFLLLGIGVYISLLIFFTFELLLLTGVVYIILIPVSFFHYRYLNKKFIDEKPSEEEIEDIL